MDSYERLPKTVIPNHYNIELKPDLVKCSFTGSLAILVQISKPTSQIVLNSVDLLISAAKITISAAKKVVIPLDISICEGKEIATFSFGTELPEGDAILEIDFSGKLTDKLRGFYISKYDVDGVSRFGAATQFESTDARRCFPCWDEPAIKATFKIQVVVPSDRVALSNMSVTSRVPLPEDPSLHIVKFKSTPVMSTYLVAIIVGEYDHVSDETKSDVLVSVYTSLGKKESGLFGLKTAVKTLEHFSDYFGIEYPLDKCDLIGLQDFSIGAMENWGLITYRESRLLVDPVNSSTLQSQTSALIIAHEICHQWFGNLVTMEWWTDLWLKEGFCKFMEYFCVDTLYPEFEIWKQFVARTFITALELDSLRNSHPIEVTVSHPSEIEAIFDEISYHKGASILRMLESYIGAEKFKAGLHLYLKTHSFSNTSTVDLWNALNEVSKMPIAETMSTWTQQVGYPLISVSCKQDGNRKRVSIHQQRFLSDGSKDDSSMWIVPIIFSCSRNPNDVYKTVILESKTDEHVFELEEHEWLKLNAGAVGFYRTQYSAKEMELLAEAIENKTMSPIDRLNILNDTAALMRAGYASTVDCLKLIQSMQAEDEYTVWSDIASCYHSLDGLLASTSYHARYKHFVSKNIQKIYNYVGWMSKPNEGHLKTLLRSLVLRLMAKFGGELFSKESQARLDAHIDDDVTIHADYRSAIYCAAMRNATQATLDRMIKLHNESTHHEERIRIASSLGSTEDEELIMKIWDFALSDDVRLQDKIFALAGLTSTCVGRKLVWTLIKTNFKTLKSLFKVPAHFNGIIKHATQEFVTEEMAMQVEKFFQENPLPGSERCIQQSVEQIRLNAAWLERDNAALKLFFSQE